MSKKYLVWLTLMGALLYGGAAVARAQEKTSTKVAADEREKPANAFRLDFALVELEDGKKVNTRHYSMDIVPGITSSGEIKMGTRVPVEGKQGEMQYIDVGTNIWARLLERGDSLQLEVRADLTNFANPEQESKTSMPLLRQLHISAGTVAPMGKPAVVGVVDDPNSKRQFQLEVTVIKLN